MNLRVDMEAARREVEGMTAPEFIRLCAEAGMWAAKVDTWEERLDRKPTLTYHQAIEQLIQMGKFCRTAFALLKDCATMDDGVPAEVQEFSPDELAAIEKTIEDAADEIENESDDPDMARYATAIRDSVDEQLVAGCLSFTRLKQGQFTPEELEHIAGCIRCQTLSAGLA
jgi:hypothetical protein